MAQVRRMQTKKRNLTPTAELIVGAAIELFSQRGYHGTSMRDIAEQIGVRPGGLYNHFDSKQDILFYLVDRWLTRLYNELVAVIESLTDPDEQMREAVRLHVHFHGVHAAEMLIADNEIRALLPKNRRIIVEKRKRYEMVLQKILSAGTKTGRFPVADRKIASFAIIGMCTHVASWYNPAGPKKIETIADLYADLILHGLSGFGRPNEPAVRGSSKRVGDGARKKSS